MAAQFSIREATADDVPGILACLAAAFEPYRPRYTLQAFADTVLMDAGVRGHLRGMAVLPDWRGSGLAAALMSAVEEALRRKACRRMTLNSVAPLERAIAFYERRGFGRTGRVTDLFGMPLVEFAMPLL